MSNLKRTFGEGPYPFPIGSLREIFDIYENDTTLMIDPKPSVAFDFYPESHYHSDYEFLIPYSPFEHAGVEKKHISLKPKEILLIQSDQPHGPVDVMKQARIFAFFFEREFFRGVAGFLHLTQEINFRKTTLRLTPDLEALIQLFMQEFQGKQMGYQMILKSLSTQIAIYILRQACDLKVCSRPSSQGLDRNVIKAMEMLQDCYNKDYTLEDVAKVANLSPYHFIRVFKLQTGKTPFAYLLDIKLDRAREMLLNQKLTITEVCYSTGFKSTSHFATVFKKKFGISPSEYRLQI